MEAIVRMAKQRYWKVDYWKAWENCPQIEQTPKSRDSDYNRTMKMKGVKHVWSEEDFNDVINNNSHIKHHLWGISPYESLKKALLSNT